MNGDWEHEGDAWRQNVVERLARIEGSLMPVDRLVKMETSLEFVRRQLYGNGKKGICELEEERLGALLGRIESVERRQSWMIGLGAGIAAAISIATTLLARLLHR